MFEHGAMEFLRESKNRWIKGPVLSFITTDKREFLQEKIMLIYNVKEDERGNRYVFGDKKWICNHLKKWLSQFNSIQFASDVCHYDFVLLIDLLTNGGMALDLQENISAVCYDINSDIARHYGISEREAFDKSREEIVSEICEKPVLGNKHNALHDAEVIKAIYKEIG